MHLLAETTSDGWRPGIGDPTFMGWFTVAAYAIAAGLCLCVFLAQTQRRSAQPRDAIAQRLWRGLAIVLGGLAVNKQLDLQSWFTAVGRKLAKSEGWYQDRQSVQLLFIMVLALLGLAAIIWLAWVTRRHWRSHGLALVGTAFIIVFVVIRAASFHHIDEFLGWDPFGVRMNWLLELGGISCVALAATMHLRRVRRSQRENVSTPQPRRPVPSSQQQRESFQWLVRRLRD